MIQCLNHHTHLNQSQEPSACQLDEHDDNDGNLNHEPPRPVAPWNDRYDFATQRKKPATAYPQEIDVRGRERIRLSAASDLFQISALSAPEVMQKVASNPTIWWARRDSSPRISCVRAMRDKDPTALSNPSCIGLVGLFV